MRVIAACTYFNLIVCLLLFGWLVRNIKKFLIGLKKYQVYPLVTFYFISILLVLTRFAFLIWCYPLIAKGELFVIHSSSMLKFGLGLN